MCLLPNFESFWSFAWQKYTAGLISSDVYCSWEPRGLHLAQLLALQVGPMGRCLTCCLSATYKSQQHLFRRSPAHANHQLLLELGSSPCLILHNTLGEKRPRFSWYVTKPHLGFIPGRDCHSISKKAITGHTWVCRWSPVTLGLVVAEMSWHVVQGGSSCRATSAPCAPQQQMRCLLPVPSLAPAAPGHPSLQAV